MQHAIWLNFCMNNFRSRQNSELWLLTSRYNHTLDKNKVTLKKSQTEFCRNSQSQLHGYWLGSRSWKILQKLKLKFIVSHRFQTRKKKMKVNELKIFTIGKICTALSSTIRYRSRQLCLYQFSSINQFYFFFVLKFISNSLHKIKSGRKKKNKFSVSDNITA